MRLTNYATVVNFPKRVTGAMNWGRLEELYHKYQGKVVKFVGGYPLTHRDVSDNEGDGNDLKSGVVQDLLATGDFAVELEDGRVYEVNSDDIQWGD